MHERHALGGGEVHRAQAGHGHAGGDTGGGVLGFRFSEDQRPAGDVDMAGGNRSAQYSPICVDGVIG